MEFLIGIEHYPFQNLREAIDAVQKFMIPDDIIPRYCSGNHTWVAIVEQSTKGLDEVFETSLGRHPGRLILAAYLVNIMAQGLIMELAYGQKVDIKSRDLISLNVDEIACIQTTLFAVVEFAQKSLNVPVRIIKDDQPFVNIQ